MSKIMYYALACWQVAAAQIKTGTDSLLLTEKAFEISENHSFVADRSFLYLT
jgi:hypothetical protein